MCTLQAHDLDVELADWRPSRSNLVEILAHAGVHVQDLAAMRLIAVQTPALQRRSWYGLQLVPRVLDPRPFASTGPEFRLAWAVLLELHDFVQAATRVRHYYSIV